MPSLLRWVTRSTRESLGLTNASSKHSSLYIEPSSSLESDARRSIKSQNKAGNPIVLPTKVLAIARNPDASNSVYVAESAGVIKRVDLHTRDVTKTFRGPSAPLTSICVSNDGRTLFAGCWDKLIWSWDVPSARFKKPFPGHTDFVKTVMTIPAKLSPTKSELLVSGGADSEIIFWDIESGKRLNVLKGHSRGIQAIILDPMAVPTSSKDSAAPLLWSASSSREIRPCIIAANSTPSEQLDLLRSVSLGDALLQHNTSVYRLCFDEDGDMWTASADNTAQHLVRSQGWTSDTTLTHPDFVNDIAINETGGWVITACRDEEVRVWDRATGSLHHTFSGHFDAVTGLCLLEDTNTLVSVSIDATIRTWSMKPADLEQAVVEARRPKTEEEGGEESKGNIELTEDEERELAELMAGDE